MKLGRCCLCHAQKPLLKKSHIIPDFVYQGLYDEGHRLTMFSPKEQIMGGGKVKSPPTAPYSSHILCASCDNSILGKYESYASDFLFAKELSRDYGPHSISVQDPLTGYGETRVSNIRYNELKLFYLANLWRAHHSDHPFYNDVQLGDDEEELRKYLLSGRAPNELSFPIISFAWIRQREFPSDIVVQPRGFIIHGQRGYSFMFQGIIVMILLTHEPILEKLTTNLLREDGTQVILELPTEQAVRFFGKQMGLTPEEQKQLSRAWKPIQSSNPPSTNSNLDTRRKR